MTQNKKQNKTTKPKTTKSTTETPAVKKVKDDSTFIREAAENIEAGVKVVSEKTSDVAEKIVDKTSKLAGDIFDKIKKGITEAYEFSSKAVDDLGKTAQGYIEKYETSMEMRKLRDERNNLATELGKKVYADFKAKKIAAAKLIEDSDINTKIHEITKLDKDIIKLGKKIESTKKN